MPSVPFISELPLIVRQFLQFLNTVGITPWGKFLMCLWSYSSTWYLKKNVYFMNERLNYKNFLLSLLIFSFSVNFISTDERRKIFSFFYIYSSIIWTLSIIFSSFNVQLKFVSCFSFLDSRHSVTTWLMFDNLRLSFFEIF